MRIKDLKLRDTERNAAYYYIDEKNTEIKEYKLKKEIISTNSGYYLITGKIEIANGTIYPAILGISSDDGGELFEAYFLVKNKWVSQQDENFLKKLEKKKYQVFPYKYHLNVKIEDDNNLDHQF